MTLFFLLNPKNRIAAIIEALKNFFFANFSIYKYYADIAGVFIATRISDYKADEIKSQKADFRIYIIKAEQEEYEQSY